MVLRALGLFLVKGDLPPPPPPQELSAEDLEYYEGLEHELEKKIRKQISKESHSKRKDRIITLRKKTKERIKQKQKEEDKKRRELEQKKKLELDKKIKEEKAKQEKEKVLTDLLEHPKKPEPTAKVAPPKPKAKEVKKVDPVKEFTVPPPPPEDLTIIEKKDMKVPVHVQYPEDDKIPAVKKEVLPEIERDPPVLRPLHMHEDIEIEVDLEKDEHAKEVHSLLAAVDKEEEEERVRHRDEMKKQKARVTFEKRRLQKEIDAIPHYAKTKSTPPKQKKEIAKAKRFVHHTLPKRRLC
jgi:hypothetical protein